MSDKLHIPRWIYASMTQHFDDNRSTLKLVLEENPRPDNSFEIRMDGPDFIQLSGDYYNVDVDINVLVQTLRTDQDFHAIHRNVGIIVEAFTNTINIYKYGLETGDDDTSWACATRQSKVLVTHFGQVDKETHLYQATVEAIYQIKNIKVS
jgi:hypothetical protein